MGHCFGDVEGGQRKGLWAARCFSRRARSQLAAKVDEQRTPKQSARASPSVGFKRCGAKQGFCNSRAAAAVSATAASAADHAADSVHFYI